MTRTRQAIASAVAIATFLLVVAAARSPAAADRGSAPGGIPVRGNSSLDETRALEDPDLLYAGDRVAGLPLSAVERRTDEATYVSFLYGDCTAGDHYGCALPLEIQVWPACVRSPELYDAGDPFAPRPESARVRGVPGAALDEGRQLELRTGSSTVVIFGETRALVNRAAAALRGLAGGVRPGDPLRPPVAVPQRCD